MRRHYLSAAVLVVGAVALMNVARIERRNTPVDPADTIDAHSRMPQKVADIFQRACADCHTEQTHWPWYSKVAPFQWLITADVYGGRAHLNLSTWGRYKEDQRAERLAGICEMVSGDRMPLLHYRLAHYPAAWLSENDKKAVCDWVKAEVGLNAAGAAEPRRSGPELDTPSAKMVARRPDDISE